MKYPIKYYILYIFILYIIGKAFSILWGLVTGISTTAINGGF